MKNFAAIDFETANECHSSVCSVGVVVVRDGVMADSFYSLIKPKPNYYRWFCQEANGLGHEDTDNAEVFPVVWAMVAPLIEGLPLVAHNKQFDESCLREVMEVYQMDWPDYQFYCTLEASRKMLQGLENYQLHTVSAACGYNLEHHHHALADAEACAVIAIKLGI